MQPWCPVVGWRPQHAASTSAHLVLSSARWYPSSSHLVRLSNISPVFLWVFSFHTVSRWWYAVSIGHLISCWRSLPMQVHFRLLTCSITSVTLVFSLTQLFVFLFRYVMFNILLSIFVCTVDSLFFAWLVSAHVSAPYVIARSMHEL